jgi:hypothetical protein
MISLLAQMLLSCCEMCSISGHNVLNPSTCDSSHLYSQATQVAYDQILLQEASCPFSFAVESNAAGGVASLFVFTDCNILMGPCLPNVSVPAGWLRRRMCCG